MHSKYFWLAVVWTFLITVLCLVNSNSLEGVDVVELKNKDKILHFVFYFIFTGSWYLFFRGKYGSSAKIKFFVFLFAVLYGGLIEICQLLFAAGRSADVLDAVANTVGSVMAVLCILLYKKIKK